MPRIANRLPNGSELLNGVPFTRVADGSLVTVDDLSDDDAVQFLSIPGFEVYVEKQSKKAAATQAAAPPPADPSKTAAQ